MSDIVEAVKQAIRLNIENQRMPQNSIGMVDKYDAAARAAIEAYEVEQRKLQTHRATLQSAYNDAYIRGGFLDRVGKP